MKKVLIATAFLLMAVLSSEAQKPTVCQPDSVVYYLNMSAVPSYWVVNVDSSGWMKFTYNADGLLTHFRQENFSDLLRYTDYEFEYDLSHNLTETSIKRDYQYVDEDEERSEYKEVYTYQSDNQLSTYSKYYYDEHAPQNNPWDPWDSVSYQYDALGRVSKRWEASYPGTYQRTISDYDYQDNEVIVTTQARIQAGDWSFFNKRTFLYSDNGLLLSCLLETTDDTFLTTYSYNEQGKICGILKQKLQNDEYVNMSRVVFELNEDGYPSVVSFEKWEEEWVEGSYTFQIPPKNDDDYYFIFTEGFLSQQNKQVLVNYVKRLEIYYSHTSLPDYAVDEQTETIDFATLHPNPTNGLVTITGNDLKQAELINTLGQCVASVKGEGGQLTVDISGLPAGVYFVNITDGEGRKCVKKVVKE